MLKFHTEVHHRYSRQRKVGNPHFSYYIGLERWFLYQTLPTCMQ